MIVTVGVVVLVNIFVVGRGTQQQFPLNTLKSLLRFQAI